ncbi:Gfo/Idh/MocA family protein [Paracoccus sp. (in: a-proteobacteria)]|uniref:Gfo/Idh/MocA family protein n=1 Tax=Paracoccus sp. TaxID=267 RepID=UPI003A84C760
MQTAVMVGCGAMSEGWLRAIAEIGDKVSLVGFVDLDPELARRRAEQAGTADAVTGTALDAVLKQVRPDMVFDIVVPSARAQVVETAFAAGCDVLSEKPMAGSLTEARHLLELRNAHGRLHAIVQNRRFLTGIRRAKAFLDSGAIGEVAEVHCDFFIAPHFGGFREEMAHVLLHDMAIHTFDAARFVAGVRPRRVVCLESNPRHSWYRSGASAAALFDCEGGVTFSYRGSWCAEGAPTSWEASWRMVGSKGTLIWDGNEGFRAEVPGERDGLLAAMTPVDVPALTSPLPFQGHAGVIADFLDARLTGQAPLSDSRDNFHSLAMTLAAIDSVRRGTFVPVES